ncbi:hypothetical protein EV182_006724, partial [Spiromyces aspiralis]
SNVQESVVELQQLKTQEAELKRQERQLDAELLRLSTSYDNVVGEVALSLDTLLAPLRKTNQGPQIYWHQYASLLGQLCDATDGCLEALARGTQVQVEEEVNAYPAAWNRPRPYGTASIRDLYELALIEHARLARAVSDGRSREIELRAWLVMLKQYEWELDEIQGSSDALDYLVRA